MSDPWSIAYDALKYQAEHPTNPDVVAAKASVASSSGGDVKNVSNPTAAAPKAAAPTVGVRQAAAAAQAMYGGKGLTGNILSGLGGFEEGDNSTSKLLLGW